MPRKGNAPARIPACHPDRKHAAKGLCSNCYCRDYGANNRARLNANAKNWSRRNPDRVRAARIKYRYGITSEDVRLRVVEQGGLCKVCAAAPATDVDHNHVTGMVRGVLCGDCNRAIGLLRDDPDRMRRAASYVEDDIAIQAVKDTGKRVYANA